MTPMTSAFRSRAPRGLAVIVFGLLLAACSPGAASVAPSATAVATAEPTAAPTVAVTPSASTAAAASASAQPDPSVDLKIDAPYALTALDPTLESVFRTQFAQNSSGFGSLIGFGGRTITKADTLAGYVLVIGLPAGMLSDTAYQAMLAGMEPGLGTTLKTEKISGVDVSTGTAATASVAVMKDGDNVVMTLTPTAAELPAIEKALIDANK